MQELTAGTSESLEANQSLTPRQIVEAYRPVLQVPQDRALPFTAEKPHASFDRARLEAGFHDMLAACVVNLDG